MTFAFSQELTPTWEQYLAAWERADDHRPYCTGTTPDGKVCGHEVGQHHEPGCTTQELERQLAEGPD